MPSPHRSLLAAEFGLDESTDVFEVPGMHALSDLMEIVDLAETDAPGMRRTGRASRLAGVTNPLARRQSRNPNSGGSR